MDNFTISAWGPDGSIVQIKGPLNPQSRKPHLVVDGHSGGSLEALIANARAEERERIANHVAVTPLDGCGEFRDHVEWEIRNLGDE